MTDSHLPPQGFPPPEPQPSYPAPGYPPSGYPPQPQPYQPQSQPQSGSGSGGKKACLIVGTIFAVIALLTVGAAVYLGVVIGGGVGKIISAVDAGSDLYRAEGAAMEYYEAKGEFTDDPDTLERLANTGRETRRTGPGSPLKVVRGTPAEAGEVGATLCAVGIPPDLKMPLPGETPTPAGAPTPAGTQTPAGTPTPAETQTPAGTPTPLDAPLPTSTASPAATSSPKQSSTKNQVLMLAVRYDKDKAFTSLLIEGEVMYRTSELAGCPTSLPPEGNWFPWSHVPFDDPDSTSTPTPTPTKTRRR